MTARRHSNQDTGQWSRIALALCVLLAFSFVFGGASYRYIVRLAVVELAALPVLILALTALVRSSAWRDHRFACGLALATAAIPLIHLIPLPPALWTALPGRDQLVLALSVTGIQPGWGALSLTPDQTWRNFLALLPPMAAFAAALALPIDRRPAVIWLVLGAATLSIILVAAQVASGDRTFYLWSWVKDGALPGPFQNRNHMAALCTSTLPFAAVLAATAMNSREPRARMMVWLGALYVILAVIAVGVIRSRAGVVLVLPSLVAALLAAWVASGRARPSLKLLGLTLAAGGAVAAVAVFGLGPVLERFDTIDNSTGRFAEWPTVIEAAQTYLPVGSGVGSFDPVYRSFEPLERLDGTYFNNAHNDFLEIWLETGWVGIGLLLVFLYWFGKRAISAWRGGALPERNLQRAASIAIFLLLAHSVVDYPMRTEILAVWFALCCGVLEFAGRQGTDRSHRAA